MLRPADRMRNSLFGRFLSDKSGATAIEYGFLALLIGLAIASAILAVGNSLLPYFESAAEPFKD